MAEETLQTMDEDFKKQYIMCNFILGLRDRRIQLELAKLQVLNEIDLDQMIEVSARLEKLYKQQAEEEKKRKLNASE
jgi:hypothetical protein